MLPGFPSKIWNAGDFLESVTVLTPLDVLNSKKDVVDVFIDYENVRRTARGIFYDYDVEPHLGVVDPVKLAERIVPMRRNDSVLRHVHVFRGRPNPTRQPKPAAAFSRLDAMWSKSSKFISHYRDLKYTSHSRDSQTGEEIFTATEKGVDVELAVSLISTAAAGNRPTAVILVSNDTDLLPAVKHVYEDPNTHIEIASWAGPASHPLFIREYLNSPEKKKVPYCHFLNEECFESVCQDDIPIL